LYGGPAASNPACRPSATLAGGDEQLFWSFYGCSTGRARVENQVAEIAVEALLAALLD